MEIFSWLLNKGNAPVPLLILNSAHRLYSWGGGEGGANIWPIKCVSESNNKFKSLIGFGYFTSDLYWVGAVKRMKSLKNGILKTISSTIK